MGTIKNGYHGGIIIIYGRLTKIRKRNLLERIVQLRAPGLKRLTVFFQSEPEIGPALVEL
jgi:hypothetical protein